MWPAWKLKTVQMVMSNLKYFFIFYSLWSVNQLSLVQISNSSRKMEVVEEYTLARRTESGKNAKPGVFVYQGEDSKGDNQLTFPSCYHVRFAVRVLKQLDDPEVEVMVQSLNLDMKLDCRQYNLQDLISGCSLTPSDPANWYFLYYCKSICYLTFESGFQPGLWCLQAIDSSGWGSGEKKQREDQSNLQK